MSETLKPREVHRSHNSLLIQLKDHINQTYARTGRSTKEIPMQEGLVAAYIGERTKRALELQTPEVKEASTLATNYFNEAVGGELFVGWELCMDRRTRKTFIAGIPGRVGGSINHAGGKPTGFMRIDSGKSLRLNPRSRFAQEINTLLTEDGRYTDIVEIFDSHVACAARGQEELIKTGAKPADNGQLEDVKYKKMIASAVKKFAATINPSKEVTTVQTSFDPHDGYLVMGLAKDEIIKYGNLAGGFTPEVVKRLIDDNNIASAKKLAEGPLKEIFGKHYVSMDWMQNYAFSALNFWQHLTDMREKALPIVESYLSSILPNFDKNGKDIKIRARILLANAYHGWLHNPPNMEKYPYGTHNENVIVALAGEEHVPFNTEALAVYRDQPNPLSEAVLASTIIRQNRMRKEAGGELQDPVPFIIQTRIREPLTLEQLESIGKIDWKKLQASWRNMSYKESADFIVKQNPQIPTSFTAAFAHLGETMKKIYNAEDSNSEYVYNGNILCVPMIVGPNREPIAIIPFIPPRD